MDPLHLTRKGKRKPCKAEKRKTAFAIVQRSMARRQGKRVDVPLSADRLTISQIALTCLHCRRCPNHAERMKRRWDWFADRWGEA